MTDCRFSDVGASQYLREAHDVKVSIVTLKNWRAFRTADTPSYFKEKGRVWYLQTELDRWATESIHAYRFRIAHPRARAASAA